MLPSMTSTSAFQTVLHLRFSTFYTYWFRQPRRYPVFISQLWWTGVELVDVSLYPDGTRAEFVMSNWTISFSEGAWVSSESLVHPPGSWKYRLVPVCVFQFYWNGVEFVDTGRFPDVDPKKPWCMTILPVSLSVLVVITLPVVVQALLLF